MPDSPYRGRFAPSPTGPLHAGSLYTAVASWLLARHAGGQWLVRVEDVDRDRCIPGAAEQQIATLAAFGLHSDLPIVWQSQRQHLYQRALDALLADGKAFVCGCSRSQLAASHGLHQHCVTSPRSDGRNAVRLHTAASGQIRFHDQLQGQQCQDVHGEVGDFVLFRADGCWAYQLAVVVDDAGQGITDVVRGADLLDSSARQIWLQQCLGLPTPGYLHLPLLTDANGHKLSKSDAAQPVDAAGSADWLRWIWHLLGQAEGALDAANSNQQRLCLAVERFEPARLPQQLPPAPTMPASLLRRPTP
ncbi:MAG: tRNA glutamyl-Q(34) synthetase GluQRS [Stenotrophomonas sp.]